MTKESTEMIDYHELMLRMQADMTQLSGEDLAELAMSMGIEVTYQGDSMFTVGTVKNGQSSDKLDMLNQTVKNGIRQ